MMHGHGKPANNAGRSAAEPVEPRAGTKGNAGQQSACRTQGRANASQALERIRQAFAVWTRGRSRMRESCMYGSERGARGNSRPYRDRREVMLLLSSAAIVSPLTARAQQPGKLPTIGFLGATPSIESQRVAAFVQRLRELAWIDGRNLAIEYRWAEGRNERYAENAAELVRLKADVIVTVATPPTLAAKQATAVIPIVFAAVSDPVGTGLVASRARSGGNLTGLANQISDTGGKKLELLREVVPGLRRLAIMVNVGNPASVLDMGEAQATARALGLEITTSEIRRAEDIAPAFGARKGRADALYVCVDPLVNTHRIRINTLALAARLPTMH